MCTVKLKIRNDLVKKNGKNVETSIYVQLCYEGKIKMINTNQKVLPDNWKNGEVKKSENYTTKNAILTKIKASLENIVQHAKYNNIVPSLEYVEAKYLELSKPVNVQTVKDGFLDIFDSFIEQREKSKKFTRATIIQYVIAKKHLMDFAKKSKYKLAFSTIDSGFIEKYESYLRNENKRPNSIGSQIKFLKCFMEWAAEHGHHTNLVYKKFKKPTEETEIVVLNENEIQKLADLDLTDQPRLERVRDLFLVQCYTGLRFSDLANLEPTSFDGDLIRIRTVKTRDYLKIPILPSLVPILIKYDYKLPKMSGQRMNSYLKELGQMADLEGFVKKHVVINGRIVIKDVPKYEMLSSHVGRKSFVTIAIKKGIPTATIMNVTGHSQLSTLERYIKIVEEDTKHAFFEAYKK